MFLIVGRLDDGNADDGRPVDVDIELGYVVGEDVNNNVGTSDGINELNKDGFLVGKDDVASLLSAVVGRKDKMIKGLKDRVALNFRVGPKVGMDDGIQDGTAVGTSLGLREGETLDNEDGLTEGKAVAASVG